MVHRILKSQLAKLKCYYLAKDNNIFLDLNFILIGRQNLLKPGKTFSYT